MGTVNRWLKYAKAKLDATVKSGNDEMDRLEAEQEAEAADRPWLKADGQSPTLEEARARIRWEAEDAARQAKGDPAAPSPASPPSGDSPKEPAAPGASAPTSKEPTAKAADKDEVAAKGPSAPATSDDAGQASKDPTSPAGPQAPATDPMLDPILPSTPEEAAARSNARIELERREREAAARLEEIRRELGVDPPSPPANPGGAGSG